MALAKAEMRFEKILSGSKNHEKVGAESLLTTQTPHSVYCCVGNMKLDK